MSVLINGSPHGYFSPKRGLRQGDPIFPYLFIISMEILSRLLYKAEAQGAIRGIQISRCAPKISHLMFADDLFILSRETLTDTNNIKGFRRAEDSNRAILSKTAWALTSNSNSVASRVMKTKYGNFIAPLQFSAASTLSIWKGLNWCRNTLQTGHIADLSDCLRHIKRAFVEFSTYQAPQPHFDSDPGFGQSKKEAICLSDEWKYIHTDAAWTTESASLAGTRKKPNMPISHSWSPKQRRLLPCKLKPKQSCWQSHWPLTMDGARFGLGLMLYC
ncbi:hypothetical protein CRG98_046903 [Punica granatum]|uniref:Reverse transcriptase domain-containing protein n=1 Tax=Punica granatum TaxID=22663 RepID=A0A2I0HN50_PUNGR|nr:hypothetical protein CRG98_046903 [Punica granatum]